MSRNAPSDIDTLAAATEITSYPEFRMVDIPGVEALPEIERKMILDRALERNAALPNLDLVARLRNMTPPPDEDDSLDEAYGLEKQAREQLECDGCPPCYPPHLPLPLDHVPEKYKTIIEFWKAQSGVKYEVLCAQWRDWQRFRSFQERARHFYGKAKFELYNRRIHDRNQQRTKSSTLSAEWDIKKQSKAQTWLEFAHYHQKNYEALERKYTTTQMELEHAQSLDEEEVTALQNQQDYYMRLATLHTCLLDWIEQERAIILRKHKQRDASQGLPRKPTRLKNTRKAPEIGRSSALRASTKQNADTTSDTQISRLRDEKSRSIAVGQKVKQKTPVPELVKTRSGRISRRPSRWVPG